MAAAVRGTGRGWMGQGVQFATIRQWDRIVEVRCQPLSVVKLTGRCRAEKFIDELVSKREQNDD